MREMKKQKLLLLFMTFVLIFSLCMLVPHLRGLYALALSAAAVAASAFLGRAYNLRIKNLIFILIAAATAFLSVSYSGFMQMRNSVPLSYVGREARIKAVVTEVSYVTAYSSSYRVRVTEADGAETDFWAVAEISSGTHFEYGDIILLSGGVEALERESSYLRGKNIFVKIDADDAYRCGSDEKNAAYYLHTANDYLSRRMRSMMGEESGGLCSALVLGNRKYVSSGMRLAFSRAGISHLLALSGLHLSVLAQTLDFVLRGAVGKKLRNVISMIFCFAFVMLTGFSVSALRAAVMLAFVFTADIVGKENDSLTALFAAACIIFVVNGNAVYDIGFWLSFCSTLGIILLNPSMSALFAKWQKPKKKKLMRILHVTAKYFYGIFCMSIASSFFTLPAVAFSFGEVSLISAFSNFLFIPLAAVLLVSCMFFIPLSFLPFVSGAAAFWCAGVSSAVLRLAEAVSDLRGIVAPLDFPFAPHLFAALALCLAALIFVKRVTLVKFLSVAVVFSVSFALCHGVYGVMTRSDVRVVVASDSSREYVVFDALGENYVVDISTGGYSFMYDAVSAAKGLSRTEIDNLVLTHYHIYHPNSIYRLSQAVKLRNIILPAPETADEREIFAEITALLSRLGISHETYVRGETYTGKGVAIDFAPRRNIPRSVKPLVAFCVRAGDASFAYIEGAALEAELDYAEILSAQTVFVGDHGPNRKIYTSADALLSADRVILSDTAAEYLPEAAENAHFEHISESGGVVDIIYKRVFDTRGNK